MANASPVASAPGAVRYLVAEDVAELLGMSVRTVHERTRLGRIPHQVLPQGRRCLFRKDWLEAWANGAELELVELAHGGRICRPIGGEE
jgi:excisionase family DNA binding protein